MGLAIALDLGRFVEQLPRARASAYSRSIGLPVKDSMMGNITTIGKIAVVGDRKHVAPGLFLVGRHPFPQIARIVASQWAHRDEGHDTTGLIPIVAEDHVAMEIVAPSV